MNSTDPASDTRTRLDAVPGDVHELAELASLAAAVTPELLRALRLDAVPHLDAGCEADVWWSPLVDSRGIRAVTFTAEVTRALRRRLRDRVLAGDPTVHRARTVVEGMAPPQPSLRLEQDVAWLAVRDGAAAAEEINAELGRAVEALVAQDRTGLAGWWRSAWARLPDEARSVPSAVQLSLLTAPLLGGDAVALDSVAATVLDARVAAALRTRNEVDIQVRRSGPHLELGVDVGIDGAGTVTVAAPDSRPVLLEVRTGNAADEVVLLRTGVLVLREVGAATVRLRTAHGAVYEIPPDLDAPPPVALRPWYTPAPGVFATPDDGAFALRSTVASRVELCLFDADDQETRLDMHQMGGTIWAAFVPGAGLGTRYGYRVHGPYVEDGGPRCDPTKLLIDPYARAIDGPLVRSAEMLDRPPGADDIADVVPRAIVVNPYFDWGSDRPPWIPWSKTVLYEAHVGTLTLHHPAVPEELRGRFGGLAHPAVVEHLQSLGVTAVVLMPVQQFADADLLHVRGEPDQWGYDTLCPFAPHRLYACADTDPGDQVDEFREMVRALHAAGIEVILDVTLTHTGEGGPDTRTITVGPRGVDAEQYYVASADDHELNLRSSMTRQLIMDMLRYWVTEMHVDGFRLCPTDALARQLHRQDSFESLVAVMQQDFIVSQVKLIAGRPPTGPDLPEWWGRTDRGYRDTVRDFWRGTPGLLSELASRFAGSAEHAPPGARPTTTVNVLASHDGFTLADVVSYDRPHDERGGTPQVPFDERSWNCGIEGPTDDQGVLDLRARQQRNMLTTLLLGQGVPLLAHGDERGRTLGGAADTRHLDPAVAALDWTPSGRAADLEDFAGAISRLRARHPVFRRRSFLTGRPVRLALPDVVWLTADGRAMTEKDWEDPENRSLLVFLNGVDIDIDTHGNLFADDSFLVCFNAHWDGVDAIAPSLADVWEIVADTATGAVLDDPVDERPQPFRAGEMFPLPGRSILVLRSRS